ncbi:MAG: phosphoribosylglycinamide formyltransferase [Rhodospirillales bacterium]
MKLGVLISGRGSNLQALIDACANPDFPAEIALVISNRPNAVGLERAKKARLNSQTIDHKAFKDRASFEHELTNALENAGVELVCLAGFMRVLTPKFTERWAGKAINIHPSLLPSFPGLHTHERALEAGCRFAGATVHFVSAEMDEGPIIIQATTPILPNDDANSLAARVLQAEHEIYVRAVRWIAEGKILRKNGSVSIQGIEDEASYYLPTTKPSV